MRIAVYPETGVSALGKEIDALHLARPVSAAKLSKILHSGNVKGISLSPSTYRRLSEKARALINESGAGLEVRKRQGRSLGIDKSSLSEIVEMHRDFRSYREIEEKLGVPKSTAHYLIRYAKRSKLKKGRTVFYLD
jgi:hypothetical protein